MVTGMHVLRTCDFNRTHRLQWVGNRTRPNVVDEKLAPGSISIRPIGSNSFFGGSIFPEKNLPFCSESVVILHDEINVCAIKLSSSRYLRRGPGRTKYDPYRRKL